MRLKRISAQNYRQFAELDLEFPDVGLFGIVGMNGAGKSTVIEAIRFSAYGVDACRTVKDGVARTGADGPTWVEVAYASQALGNVVVRRELDGEATVAVNGSLVAKSPRGVTAHMTSLLGMDLRAWKLSFECPQKELDGFGKLGPAGRREQLLRWLGILRLDKVIERVRGDGKTAKASWEGLSAGLPDTNDLERRIAEAVERQWELDASLETLRAATVAKQTELEQARARADELATTAATDARLAGEIVALETRQTTSEQRRAVVGPAVDELRALSATQEALAGATGALAGKRQELQALTSRAALRESQEARLGRADAAVIRLTTDVGASREPDQDHLTAKLVEADEALAVAEADLSTVTDETTRTRVELDRCRRDVEAAIARYKRIESLGAEAPCPTCEQPLGEKRALLLETVRDEGAANRKVSDALATTLLDLQRRKAEATERLGLARAAQRVAQKALEAGRVAATTRAGLVSQLNQAESEREDARAAVDSVGAVDAGAVAALQSEIATLEKQGQECQRNAGRLEGLPALERELADLLRAAVDIAAELDTKRATRADVGNDPKALAASQTFLAVAQDAAQSSALDLQRAENDRTTVVRDLDVMRAQLAEATGRKDAAEAARVKAVRLGALSERFSGFRDHLVGRIRPTLSALASEMFVEIVDGRYEALELTDEYEISITDRGVAYPLERFSGGEGDQAALALRLAVARQIAGAAASPAQFLLLDEPFTSFDSERLGAALSGLRRLQNVFPQIVVVSHLDALKDAATAMFTVEEGVDGRSTAVRSDVEDRAAA